MDIKEERDKLRNALFEKYFEVQDNYIKFEDLINKLTHITVIWQDLNNLLVKNSKDFDNRWKLEMLKEENYNGKDYLIIKKIFWEYLIIDLNEKRVLSKEEIVEKFNDKVFNDNFYEEKCDEDDYPKMYKFLKYSGNVQQLLELYNKNSDILNIYPRIRYQLNIGEAWTGIIINLADYSVQLHFQTPSQFLYEHLFFSGDLTPDRAQDAQEKIGLERMKEIFEKTKEIPIPISVIPKEYLSYVLDKTEEEKKFVKKFGANN